MSSRLPYGLYELCMPTFPNITGFFTRHNLIYDASEDIQPQFDRLAGQKGWNKRGKDKYRQAQRDQLMNAIAEDFEVKTGLDINGYRSRNSVLTQPNMQPASPPQAGGYRVSSSQAGGDRVSSSQAGAAYMCS